MLNRFVLVSADFLASPYIMDTELSALIRQGAVLAAVLVGACLWTVEDDLAEVRWLHDIGRDGPLNLTEQVGERDRRLTAICHRLLDMAPASVAEPAQRTGQRFFRRIRESGHGPALRTSAPPTLQLRQRPGAHSRQLCETLQRQPGRAPVATQQFREAGLSSDRDTFLSTRLDQPERTKAYAARPL